MSHHILFENCAASLASCIAAERAGAGRIELCSALTEGGTTPSAALLKLAKKHLHIPIFPIIRPRSGDFLYTEQEIEQMEEEIKILLSLGADGFATGVLTPKGELHPTANARLIQAAAGKPVTLHRAIDRTHNLLEAVEQAIQLGFARILTSGGMPTAPEGATTIRQMVKVADGRIVIMAGSGVRPSNAKELVTATHVTELHGTLQTTIHSQMLYHNTALHNDTVVVDELHHKATSQAEVAQLINALSSL